ncbi:MAG: MbtH family NRPS accessory protein [Pseudomonadota bacterium]
MSFEDTRFRVVVNDEERYSIWPLDRELPSGWKAEGFEGLRQDCSDHIQSIWRDMRPTSLDRSMDERGD